MNYTIDYFIKKFEAIPEKEWGTGKFINSDYIGNEIFCALGHCGVRNGQGTPEGKALDDLFYMAKQNIVRVNDTQGFPYTQPTAKQRILACLYDLKAKEQPKEKPCFHAPQPKTWEVLSLQTVSEEGILV